MALCAALTERSSGRGGVSVDFIGSGSDLERDLVEAAGLQYHAIRSGKFRRYGRGLVRELLDVKTVGLNTRDAWRFVHGYRDARKLLTVLQPDAVFIKGGYVGLPVGLAAHRLSIPIVLHESDLAMGLTNRVLANRAEIIATGFPIDHFQDIRTEAQFVPVGNPIRKELMKGTLSRAQREFGTKPALPTVLILGGSSGAHMVNEIVFEALPRLVKNMQVIHQTGSQDIDTAFYTRQRLSTKYRGRYVPQAFLRSELADAYRVADIVVTRAGANVLAELASLNKAALLLPLASSANNHQIKNAEYFTKRSAARMVRADQLTPRRLQAELEDLIEHPAHRRQLERAMSKLAQPGAADKLAEVIFRVVERRKDVA